MSTPSSDQPCDLAVARSSSSVSDIVTYSTFSPRSRPASRNCKPMVVLPVPGLPSSRNSRPGERPPLNTSSRPSTPVEACPFMRSFKRSISVSPVSNGDSYHRAVVLGAKGGAGGPVSPRTSGPNLSSVELQGSLACTPRPRPMADGACQGALLKPETVAAAARTQAHDHRCSDEPTDPPCLAPDGRARHRRLRAIPGS